MFRGKTPLAFVLLLFVFVLAGAGCIPHPAAIPSVVEASSLEDLDSSDVAFLQEKILATSSSSLRRISRIDAWSIPKGIQEMQMFQGISLDGDQAVFGFAEQPNINNPDWEADGASYGYGEETWVPLTFAGVLFSRDGGKIWSPLFSIPIFTTVATLNPSLEAFGPFNPVGMFIQNHVLWLDLANANRMASGEGILVRYSTTDGQVWNRDSCYKFLPEDYYDLSQPPEIYEHYGNAPIRPDRLKAVVCPEYVSQIL